jgi:hypothetical protein
VKYLKDYAYLKNIGLPIGLALYKLDLISSENMPDLATSALEQGYDSPSLRILAGLIPSLDSSWEINTYLEKALIELNISELSSSMACLILIRYYLQQIIDGDISPFEGLEKVIKNIYYNSQFQTHKLELANENYRHNYLGIEIFYGLYYQYDDYLIEYSGNYNKSFKKHESKLINNIIEEANKYIANYQNIKIELIDSEKYLEIINSIKGMSGIDYNELLININDIFIKNKITPIICENTEIKNMFGKLKKKIVKYVLNKDKKLALRIVKTKIDEVYLVDEIGIETNCRTIY